MKIYLLDINKDMTNEWKKYFLSNVVKDDIEIVHDDFRNFMNSHPDIDTVVSPANSFGLMDGGYDKAITDYFGEKLMKRVQESIILNWYGEQPVGTSISVIIPTVVRASGIPMILIHTPTMRTPEQIRDPRIIYQCMRTTLIEAIAKESENIVIPAFGGLSGKVPLNVVAKMMFLAYMQIRNKPGKINWEYAQAIAAPLNHY